MSDFRREPLISLGTKSANNEKTKSIKRSVRISVTLPESTEDGYPEFNFRDELAAWKKKHFPNNPPKQTNGLDPFNEDDDDDVRRIAQEMEAKYGTGVSSKKKRRWKKDDYADIGMGYDESDSFIDNTDGYDEMVPKNITTLHGGFYINSGALEFKTDEEVSSDESSSSSSEEDEITEKNNANKKRSLPSSSESDSDEKNRHESKEKKQKVSNGNANGLQKALKNKLFSDDKIKKIRKNSSDEDKQKTVRELLKEKREDLNLSIPPENPKPEMETTLANVDTVIESVINAANGGVQNVDDSTSKDSSVSKEVNKQGVHGEGDSTDGSPQKQEEVIKLPDSLPSDLIELVDEIKRAAADSTEGKVKFFSGPVSSILLSLERKCRTLKKSTRVRIYEHLAPFVRCRKETLIKRAKNLIIEDEHRKIKQLLSQLQGEIQRVMPNLLQSYEIESQKVLQKKKFSKEGMDSEEAKALRMPKRRFAWTEEIRKLLKEVIVLQKKCLLLEGKNKERIDDLMSNFLKTNVQILWPEGWMSMNVLQKFSNPDYKKSVSSASSLKNSSFSESDISKDSLNVSPTSKAMSSLTSKSSSLTITPIMPDDQKAKAKPALSSDIIISNVNSSNYSIKPSKALPPLEITRTTPEPASKPTQDRDEMQLVSQAKAEDLSQKNEGQGQKPVSAETSGTQNKNFIAAEMDSTSVVDLTDSVELKRKPGPKSKTKYYIEDPEKPVKVKKATSDKLKTKERESVPSGFSNKEADKYPGKDVSGGFSFSNKERLGYNTKEHHDNYTGSYALDKLISDSLSESKSFNQSFSNFAALQKNSVECTPLNLGTNSGSNSVSANTNTYPSTKPKHNPQTEAGDDIQNVQKVLENLRVLQKMASPSKSDDLVRTSVPASVITYNKGPSSTSVQGGDMGIKKSQQQQHTTSSISFQDAFQKKFIRDFNLLKASQQPSSSKSDYNSVSISCHSSLPTNTKTLNNNYNTQPYYSKLISNVSCQQPGSYNMLEDMFANLLKESQHYKSAGDKSNVQQK